MRPRLDYAGQRLGRVQLIRFHAVGSGGRCLWWGRCDCGTERAFDPHKLKTGRHVSCGCAIRTRGGRDPVRRKAWVNNYMPAYMRDYRAEHRHKPEPKEVRKAVPIDDDLKKRLMAGR
jgi:hypothetical protein